MANRKNNNGIFYVVISLLAVLGVGSALYAYSVSQTQNIETYNYYESENQPVPEEVTLGAVPGGDFYNPVTFWDEVAYGDGRNRSAYFHKITSFTDATITAAIFDPNASGYNDYYLTDLWLENSSKATTTVRICVTTSTDIFIKQDDYTILDADAGTCTLLRTVSNAFGADGAAYNSNTATSSLFRLLEYPGTDTRVVEQKMGFLINSTTNILVYATSSASDGVGNYGIIGTGNTFDGKLHVVGKESAR